jgi:hypothetical protein
MAQFKCKLSGTQITVENDWDIKTMRRHPEYDEIVEEVKPKVEPVAVKKVVSKSKEV